MGSLAVQLFQRGLLQFGVFEQQGSLVPMKLALEMLPSYPDVLQQLAETMANALPPVDRLLCTPDSLPVATAVSLGTGIPLVYSQGSGREAVFDLTGAYDIGHATALLMLVIQPFEALVEKVERVGLSVETVIGVTRLPGSTGGLTLLELQTAVPELAVSGLLPRGQADAVLRWLAGH